MQVFSSFIKREVIKERRQASVFGSWLTLELPSAAIGSSPLGCAERLLNSYGDSFTRPCTAVHAHTMPVVPMNKRQHPTLLQGRFCRLSSFSVGAAVEKRESLQALLTYDCYTQNLK